MMKCAAFVAMLMLAVGPILAWGGQDGSVPSSKTSHAYTTILNLSEEQRVRIDSRHKVFMDDLSTLRDELYGQKMELNDLWATAQPDLSAIASKQQKIGEIQGRIREKTIQHQLDCRKILTDEQREKLVVLDLDRSAVGN